MNFVRFFEQLMFKLTGRPPARVVEERLRDADRIDPNQLFKYCYRCPIHETPISRIFGEARYWCSERPGHYVTREEALPPLQRYPAALHNYPTNDPEM